MMKRHKAHLFSVSRGRRGFTLLELTITIFIASILCGAISVQLWNGRDNVATHNAPLIWQDQARAALGTMARDIRQSLQNPELSDGQLTITDPTATDGAIVYQLTHQDNRAILVRDQLEGDALINRTVLSTDVDDFVVVADERQLTARLSYFAWFGTYRARTSHQTVIPLFADSQQPTLP